MPPNARQGEARRAAIMEFLREYHDSKGYAPSMSEIGVAVGLSSLNSTRNHLLALAQSGLIEITPGIPRAIVVREPAPEMAR